MTTQASITPFRVAVPDSALADLRDRLARTRWPDSMPGTGWEYGSSLEYVRSLCETWRTGFEWRKTEARINSWPNYRLELEGQKIHFIWAQSAEPDALPLLLTHGWPGSVVEFLDVIDPLRDPVAHGGRRSDAFHLVIPSLPGYGWSGATVEPGWDIARVARAWKELMAILGYERYGAQGGDWGSMVTTRLALIDAERLTGIHLNMALAKRVDGEIDERERADLDEVIEFMRSGTGYQEIQGKNPQTLAYGLADSPAGLAGWLSEKYRDWTDCDGDPERALSREQQLANLTVYWTTNTIGSSMRLYRESQRTGNFGALDERVEVPTGIALFPRELFRFPRSWLEAAFNLKRYTRMPRGGHFAAWEQPDLFVDDVRSFFRDHR